MYEHQDVCMLPELAAEEMQNNGIQCLTDGASLCAACSPRELNEGYGHLMCGTELRDEITKIPTQRERVKPAIDLRGASNSSM